MCDVNWFEVQPTVSSPICPWMGSSLVFHPYLQWHPLPINIVQEWMFFFFLWHIRGWPWNIFVLDISSPATSVGHKCCAGHVVLWWIMKIGHFIIAGARGSWVSVHWERRCRNTHVMFLPRMQICKMCPGFRHWFVRLIGGRPWAPWLGWMLQSHGLGFERRNDCLWWLSGQGVVDSVLTRGGSDQPPLWVCHSPRFW